MFGSDDSETEPIPIFIYNEDDTAHDVRVEVSGTTPEVFIYNEDDTAHDVRVEVSGTTPEEAFTERVTIPPDIVTKVNEVGTDEFYLKATVEGVENGLDATGPAPGESEYSEDGYLIVIHDEGEEGKRVEIEPLNPGRDSTPDS